MDARSQGYIFGVIAGVSIGLIFIFVMLKFTKKGKDGGITCKYDERQERMRGKGYKYGFAALLIYDAVYALCGDWMLLFADNTFLSVLGITFGLGVAVTYWIWNDSYISLNESFGRVIVMLVIVAGCNLALGLTHISRGDLIEGGRFSINTVNFMLGIYILFELGVLLLRKACKRTEEDLE